MKFKLSNFPILKIFTGLVLAFSYFFLTIKVISYVINYAVNILYWDEYHWVNIILFENNPFVYFKFFLNEHKIGFALIVLRLITFLTSWNSIAGMNFSVIVLIFTSIIALLIKFKITKKISIFDAIIPTLFLNLYLSDGLLWGSSVIFFFPLFFLILSSYLFTFSSSLIRDILLIFSAFGSVYSQLFGIFLPIYIAFFYLLEVLDERGNKYSKLIQIIICYLIFRTFFVGYPFIQKTSSISLNLRLSLFSDFVVNTINNFLKLSLNNLHKYILPSIILVIFIYFITLLIKNKIKLFPIFILFLQTLLFLVSTGIGRASDPNAPYYGRYVSQLIPIFFASYVALSLIGNPILRNIILSFSISVFLFFYINNYHYNFEEAYQLKVERSAWKECYLKYKAAEKCNKLTEFLIAPETSPVDLERKMDLLESKKWNLFYS